MTLRKLLAGLLVALTLSVALVPAAQAGHKGGMAGPFKTSVPPTFDDTESYGPGINQFNVLITDGTGPLEAAVSLNGTVLDTGIIDVAGSTLTLEWTSDEDLQNVRVTVTNLAPDGGETEFQWWTN